MLLVLCLELRHRTNNIRWLLCCAPLHCMQRLWFTISLHRYSVFWLDLLANMYSVIIRMITTPTYLVSTLFHLKYIYNSWDPFPSQLVVWMLICGIQNFSRVIGRVTLVAITEIIIWALSLSQVTADNSIIGHPICIRPPKVLHMREYMAGKQDSNPSNACGWTCAIRLSEVLGQKIPKSHIIKLFCAILILWCIFSLFEVLIVSDCKWIEQTKLRNVAPRCAP